MKRSGREQLSMSGDERVAEAFRWLHFAGEDLQVAQRLLQSPAAPRHACYLFCQAAEKALKAALMLDGARIPFTHDLDALCSLCADHWGIRSDGAGLAELTQWGVESRYPGEWDEPTEGDAARASSCASSIYRIVAAGFDDRHPPSI
ncbi:MAG: HEPN domain-containing protein [Acidimicrobiaceae bacterium]|nr:HEPN domain-containing protein [Acidimicrobiaceae bacterium]MYH42767.1 HEPN domain-containing protein [Acidimicrobiaceae bacterium]MYI55056.1 HEPN domain-containing protein [Acidimicrobiaceae bacterium]MYJ43094.1 HEPN domain-containing protein [Acidimicrobiaceae bacterium]MYK74613.1 HEPN domain-containing protein [Acidimicrobiaceae bacterium]